QPGAGWPAPGRVAGPARPAAAEGGDPHGEPDADAGPGHRAPTEHPATGPAETVGGRRRRGTPPDLPDPGDGPSLARSVLHALLVRPGWGQWGGVLFLVSSLVAGQGALTGVLWGQVVEPLQAGEDAPTLLLYL